jgi:hypothetical protein
VDVDDEDITINETGGTAIYRFKLKKYEDSNNNYG